ncbi:MAG: amidohydrolase family protein, partial [Chlorobi bacterium]|nr:amidohydrolase family protein [Chlorobiota bacterium]
TVATLLPGTAYTLRLPMPPARALIDAGATVALASDCNPGSCYCENMQMVLSLVVQLCGMTVEEAITAATLHGAAALLREHELGSLQVGKYADFIVLDSHSYLDLAYRFGTNRVAEVWIGGKQVFTNSPSASF